MFADADSLVYETETEDVYEDFHKNKDLFDFSDYPQDSKFFDSVNEQVFGKIKDKSKGKIISAFVALNSKMMINKIKKQKESIEMFSKT